MIYSGVQLRQDTYLRGKTYPLFQPTIQRIFGTNDTSFESPNLGRLESAQKLGVASSKEYLDLSGVEGLSAFL